MGSTKLKKIDKNRYRKVYPRFRKLPVNSYMGDGPLIIEPWEVKFVDEESVTFTLKENYDSTPVITATPLGDSNDSDLNIYLTKIEIGGIAAPGSKKASVTIAASTKWTGTVLIQSVKAGT